MLPRTIFTEEHTLFRDQVRKFVEREITPHHARWEKDGIVARSAWLKAGEAGLLCATMPEQYGGAGADRYYSAILIEELSRANASGPGFGLHSDIVAPYILNYGTDEQKAKWLPKMAKGEVIGAIAMTEPGTGSDLQGVRTTAIRDGEDYVINGQKTFITNGQNADLVIVVAKTNPKEGAKGVSLILVEAGRQGFTKGRNLEKLGLKAQDTSELFFAEVRVPVGNRLGGEGQGFYMLMQELAWERLQVAIGAVANAEAALDWTAAYVKERKAFGKAIAEFQNTRFRLAEVKAEVQVARTFVDHCLALVVKHQLDVSTAAMAKYWTSEIQCKIIDQCLQLHGGYGFMWEYPITRAYADSRVQRIYAGTNEIMKELIGRTLAEPSNNGADRPLFKPEHDLFRGEVRKFFEREVVPHREEWEEAGQVSREVWRKAGAAGLLCPSIPEEYGGAGADRLYSAILIEEAASTFSSGPGFSLHSDIVAPYILTYGSEEQKKTWLPKMARGEIIGAIAMTEPGAGSDLQGIKTTAIRDGDDYVINGQKTFITNGYMSDLVIVVAKTNPKEGAKGTSLFLVEATRPGFAKGRKLKKIGVKANDTAELFFDNVRVPAGNMLGGEGQGFYLLMQELAWERMQIAIRNVSAAEAVLKETIDYTHQRKAFGRSILDFQNSRFKLAECKTQVKLGRIYVDRCLDLVVQRKLDPASAAIAKLWCTEMQGRVVDECLQLHGGYGYMWEYPVARAYADARVQRIFGGTSEIMKEIISRTL